MCISCSFSFDLLTLLLLFLATAAAAAATATAPLRPAVAAAATKYAFTRGFSRLEASHERTLSRTFVFVTCCVLWVEHVRDEGATKKSLFRQSFFGHEAQMFALS